METSFDSALRLNKWAKHTMILNQAAFCWSVPHTCVIILNPIHNQCGEIFTLTRNSHLCGFLLNWLHFKHNFFCDWITNLVSCDLTEETKKKDGRNVTLTPTCILQPQNSAESYADFYWIEMNVIHKVLYISYLLCVLLLHILRCWLCFQLKIIV